MAKILAVDDQKSILVALEGILRQNGHFVVSVTSAADALQQLAEQNFDLLITDAIMPGGKSGFELTRALREDKAHSSLPIILLTGKREKVDVERGIESGVDEYIIKPVDSETLIAKVSSLLEQKSKAGKNLSECPVIALAQFRDETEVVGVSEIGMTLKSNLCPIVGSRIKIETNLFEEIGIQSPYLRVVSCSSPDPATNKVSISVHFTGFNESDLQSLRHFITSKQRKGSAA